MSFNTENAIRQLTKKIEFMRAKDQAKKMNSDIQSILIP